LLIPWLFFIIKGLEQGWSTRCQFKVTGWGIQFICGMILGACWHFKTRLESGPVTTDPATTDVNSYKSLINAVKPVHSLTHSLTQGLPFNFHINLRFSNQLSLSLFQNSVSWAVKWNFICWIVKIKPWLVIKQYVGFKYALFMRDYNM